MDSQIHGNSLNMSDLISPCILLYLNKEKLCFMQGPSVSDLVTHTIHIKYILIQVWALSPTVVLDTLTVSHNVMCCKWPHLSSQAVTYMILLLCRQRNLMQRVIYVRGGWLARIAAQQTHLVSLPCTVMWFSVQSTKVTPRLILIDIHCPCAGWDKNNSTWLLAITEQNKRQSMTSVMCSTWL